MWLLLQLLIWSFYAGGRESEQQSVTKELPELCSWVCIVLDNSFFGLCIVVTGLEL